MVTRASGVDIDQRAQSKNPVERLKPVFDKIRKHYRRWVYWTIIRGGTRWSLFNEKLNIFNMQAAKAQN